MSTLTLPIVAGLDYDGRIRYAAHLIQGDADARNVVWLDEPVIPVDKAETHRWATDDEVKAPHTALDLTAVSTLLFRDGRNPEPMADAQLWEVISLQLLRCRCDIAACVDSIAAEYLDYPQDSAARMTKCVLRAARLLGTEA